MTTPIQATKRVLIWLAVVSLPVLVAVASAAPNGQPW